ncbi:MAG: hypothetical protein ACJ77J_10955, partial [Gemmatimonadaceae bacterium]
AALAEAAARRAVVDSTARANGLAPLGVTDPSAAAAAARAAAPRPAPVRRPVDTSAPVRRDTLPDTTRPDSVRTDTIPHRPGVTR